MPDVFLSYNREDQARAKLFADAFEREGLTVWWDVGLRSGEAYDEVTERALRTAKAVVVLWSKKSVQSPWVRAEATLADRNKTLVPAMVEACERPIMFELVQTAELSHWQGAADDKAWLAFVAGVRGFLARAPGAPALAATLRQIQAEPAPPPETTLAVLPFDNLSTDAEMAFFSDGVSEDILGRLTRKHLLFSADQPALRADPRFMKLCARLGLVEYWLATQTWPDCADVVPYDFRAECEKYRDYPKDKFFEPA